MPTYDDTRSPGDSFQRDTAQVSEIDRKPPMHRSLTVPTTHSPSSAHPRAPIPGYAPSATAHQGDAFFVNQSTMDEPEPRPPVLPPRIHAYTYPNQDHSSYTPSLPPPVPPSPRIPVRYQRALSLPHSSPPVPPKPAHPPKIPLHDPSPSITNSTYQSAEYDLEDTDAQRDEAELAAALILSAAESAKKQHFLEKLSMQEEEDLAWALEKSMIAIDDESHKSGYLDAARPSVFPESPIHSPSSSISTPGTSNFAGSSSSTRTKSYQAWSIPSSVDVHSLSNEEFMRMLVDEQGSESPDQSTAQIVGTTLPRAPSTDNEGNLPHSFSRKDRPPDVYSHKRTSSSYPSSDESFVGLLAPAVDESTDVDTSSPSISVDEHQSTLRSLRRPSTLIGSHNKGTGENEHDFVEPAAASSLSTHSTTTSTTTNYRGSPPTYLDIHLSPVDTKAPSTYESALMRNNSAGSYLSAVNSSASSEHSYSSLNDNTVDLSRLPLPVRSQTEPNMMSRLASRNPSAVNVNHFVDADLLLGVSVGFAGPSISTQLIPMQGVMPNIFSLPYGRCPPLHLQAPNWRHLLKMMARLSGSRIEPTLDALTLTKSDPKLRTVIQFVKPHHSALEWRTVLWFTVDHPVPSAMPGALKYTQNDVNVLPWTYTLSNLPALLQNDPDSHISKRFTIPSTNTIPYPALPITFPNLAMYLQATLEESRRYMNDSSSGMRKLAKMVQTCYPSTYEEEVPNTAERSKVSGLFKRVIGRGNKGPKKARGGGNEDTYELVTPFVPDEWG